MQVDQPAGHPLQPGVNVMTAEVGVAGVEVDADRRRLHQAIDPVQAVRVREYCACGSRPIFTPRRSAMKALPGACT